MFKKFFTYPVFLVLFLSFIGAMGFGSIIKYNYDGGEKYQFLQKPVMLFVEASFYVGKIISNKSIILDKAPKTYKHIDKNRFVQFIENSRNALLVSTRYDYSLSGSVVEIIDLKNFEIIHTYKHDIRKMNDQITNTELYPNINTNQPPTKFRYFNPLIFEDGSLLSHDFQGPLFKIDICSNIKWINDKKKFHHMKNIDLDGNIWVGILMRPESKYVKKYFLENYEEDGIAKVNSNGEILYSKSVNELLIENNILPQNSAYNTYQLGNPNLTHLNDIEPAFTDTEYWKKQDVFLSLRKLSAIVHYRPSTNKIINYITGPFAEQHDVDIISDKEILIFNNNTFYVDGQYSEVLIYNFETKKFKKLLNDQLQKENFKTHANGVSQILKDKSLLVEESVHGRIILFNKEGEKEWEYINKDKNGDISVFSFSWVVEDELFIEKFKSLVKNKKCSN